MQFWQFNRIFFQKKQEIFHSLSGNEKEESELEKINPSKCSHGHVKGDFDNTTIKKINKSRNILDRFAKLRWKRFFLTNSIFFEKVPNGQSECSFGSPVENFSTITENFSLNPCFFWKTSFCWEKNFFSSKCFYGHVVTKFDNPAHTFPEEVEQLSNNVRKWWNSTFSEKKTPRNVPVDR